MLHISTGICEYHNQRWYSYIEILEESEFFYEVKISGRDQSFHAIIGAHIHGVFFCIPKFGFGCELACIYDLSYNKHIRNTFDPYTIETLSTAISLLPPIRKKINKLYFDVDLI